jgi:cytochrome c oxidase subunit II
VHGNTRLEIAWTAAPALLLTGLFFLTLRTMSTVEADVPPDALTVRVIGKQWWWEYAYPDLGVVTANELHLPLGRPLRLRIEAPDVIHSFWVPRITGKRDMIPGRVNRLVLEVEEPGIYRGQCAEYCGGPHAWMAFYAVAEEPEAFAAWLEREALPAALPEDPFLARGASLFLDSGCGACHAIRGTAAAGQLGPDLTHVGGRHSIGAGILPNNVGTIAGWIADAQAIKPHNKMPSFNVFSGEELRALAAYLASLE